MRRGWWWFSWGCTLGVLIVEALDKIREEERIVIYVQPVPLADEAGVWLQEQQPDGG